MAPRPKFCTTAPPASQSNLKHKRRFCKFEGCDRIVKSQGLCQRHGAKPRLCKVEGCEKQAQGNFDRMCKSHFKAMKRATTPLPKVTNHEVPPPAEGSSVYDNVLPKSICYVPSPGNTMPLIAHLKAGFDSNKSPAWHRNEERRARGMFPIDNPATQLEGWERELVWMEILVLTGAPNASFRHLARAWGRDKGFHMVLAQFICERHGDVERKKKRRGPDVDSNNESPKKRKMTAKKAAPGVISADIWDDSCYGDADTNEALAVDIFNFSEQEFVKVSSKWKDSYAESEAPSSPGQASIASQAAVSAILGESTRQVLAPTKRERVSSNTQQTPSLAQSKQVNPQLAYHQTESSQSQHPQHFSSSPEFQARLAHLQPEQEHPQSQHVPHQAGSKSLHEQHYQSTHPQSQHESQHAPMQTFPQPEHAHVQPTYHQPQQAQPLHGQPQHQSHHTHSQLHQEIQHTHPQQAQPQISTQALVSQHQHGQPRPEIQHIQPQPHVLPQQIHPPPSNSVDATHPWEPSAGHVQILPERHVMQTNNAHTELQPMDHSIKLRYSDGQSDAELHARQADPVNAQLPQQEVGVDLIV